MTTKKDSNNTKKEVTNKKKKNNKNKKCKFLDKFKIPKNKNKDLYNVKEVIIVMIFSIGIGFLMCFGIISIFTGKNYFKVTRDLDKVIDTYYAIVDNYYGELDKNSIIDGAVEGMISSVGDTFTTYTTTDDTEIFNETINGSYEGIGCSVATYNDGKIVVVEVFEDSPAYTSGLKVGDIITKIDDNSLEGKSGTDVSNYVKNSGKDKVVLTIIRDSEEKEITINLSKVDIPYVSGEIIEKNDSVDKRIRETYGGCATNQQALYDGYVRAIRWASDNLKSGVIAYIVNSGFIESVSFANFRKRVEEEFDKVYIINLRGNHRTSGERCRQEGGNVFGAECRTGIAILFLVRK